MFVELVGLHANCLTLLYFLNSIQGCTKVIKSQGHCQRHGAKAKRCKVDGCDKQAQGTHDGMCKRHWKSLHCPDSTGGNASSKEDALPPAPEGDSIYDSVLPQSISYRPTLLNKANIPELKPGEDPPPPPIGISVMPLVEFLREGATSKESGWHRNAERRARGLFPIGNLSIQLEPWERQLVSVFVPDILAVTSIPSPEKFAFISHLPAPHCWFGLQQALVEILLLSGGTPFANFKDLAHAWGREKGFHHVLASNVCERRGEVERKRRSDAGKALTDEQKSKVKRGHEEDENMGPSQHGLTLEI